MIARERVAIAMRAFVIESSFEHRSVQSRSSTAPDRLRPLAELERDAIERTLVAVDGNRKDAAERLGIGLRTLYEKLKRYRLD